MATSPAREAGRCGVVPDYGWDPHLHQRPWLWTNPLLLDHYPVVSLESKIYKFFAKRRKPLPFTEMHLVSDINYQALSLNKCIMFVDSNKINMIPISEFSQSYVLFISSSVGRNGNSV